MIKEIWNKIEEELTGEYARGYALAQHLGCACLLYTSPSPRDVEESRMPSSA